MIRQDVTVPNRLGLHARAAARFVQTASQHEASVRVTVGTMTTDGKSILGLLLLVASQGTVLTIETDGADEAESLNALVALVARGFEES